MKGNASRDMPVRVLAMHNGPDWAGPAFLIAIWLGSHRAKGFSLRPFPVSTVYCVLLPVALLAGLGAVPSLGLGFTAGLNSHFARRFLSLVAS